MREHRPEAIVTQSPYEAALVRHVTRGTRLVVELHGDWRTAPRLYGSPLRRLLAPLTDRVGAYGVRRADAVRTISAFTTGLVRGLGLEPDAEFAAFIDLDAFTGEPRARSRRSRASLFVGVLERYKNVEGLADAWRRVAARRPDARLHLVGQRHAGARSPRRSPAKASSGSAASKPRRSPPRWTGPARFCCPRPRRVCRES